MSELLYLIIFITISFSQSNNNMLNILEQFRSNAQLISENQKPELEAKFSQAKTLERAGLYDESLNLYKEINKSNPGIIKYFLPLKNYLKQSESLDTLFLYTQLFADARGNDFQSKLELLDLYIIMNFDNKWQYR